MRRDASSLDLRGLTCGTLAVDYAYRPLYRILAGAIAAFAAA